MELVISLTHKGHEHVKFEMARDMVSALKVCRDTKEADHFEINDANSTSTLYGVRTANGKIDWGT